DLEATCEKMRSFIKILNIGIEKSSYPQPSRTTDMASGITSKIFSETVRTLKYTALVTGL
ncbi:18672_t:CDS:2, partial [Gigaspora rosea]